MTLLRIAPTGSVLPLHTTQSTRSVELNCLSNFSHGELIALAGRSAARWIRSIRPHAKNIWIACGPGNNGADGYACAAELQTALQPWGGQVTCTPPLHTDPLDDSVRTSFINAASKSGVLWAQSPLESTDLVVDAIFGLGQRLDRPIESPWLEYLNHLNRANELFAIDLPTGLDADTGCLHSQIEWSSRQKRYTLSLLTLKPGLWTHMGRDAAGEIWWDDLGFDLMNTTKPDFFLHREQSFALPTLQFPHSSHKGTRGKVWVVGGATGMVGAAVLASNSALLSGAGKVQLFTLQDSAAEAISASHPKIMVRGISEYRSSLGEQKENAPQVVVCGCGAGKHIEYWLPELMHLPSVLVLDADAIHAISTDSALQVLLSNRYKRGLFTILTPHPAEAAKLLDLGVRSLQQNRMLAAQKIADRTGAFVVLKGSGTVVASPYPEHTSRINPTGDARLAVAGSGDHLAGWLGGVIAQHNQKQNPQLIHELICKAVWQHGAGLAGTTFR